jgi:hypothetical protein
MTMDEDVHEFLVNNLRKGHKILIKGEWKTVSYIENLRKHKNTFVYCDSSYDIAVPWYVWRIEDIKGPLGVEFRSLMVLSKMKK